MTTETDQIISGNKLNKRLKPNRDKDLNPILLLRGKVHLYNDSIYPFEKPDEKSYYIIHIREYKNKKFNTYSIEKISDISQIKDYIKSEKLIGGKRHIYVNPNNNFKEDYLLVLNEDYTFNH